MKRSREHTGCNAFTEDRRVCTERLLPLISHALEQAAQLANQNTEELSARLQLQLEQTATAAPVAVTLHQQLLTLLDALPVDRNALTHADYPAMHRFATSLGERIDELSKQMRPNEGTPTLPAMAQSW